MVVIGFFGGIEFISGSTCVKLLEDSWLDYDECDPEIIGDMGILIDELDTLGRFKLEDECRFYEEAD